MTTPLGIVMEVAVHDDILYLLDSQSCNIRRITLSGELLSPLGQPGTGPGDLDWPQRIAVYPDGSCIVLQSFSKHAPCLTHDGDACPSLDTSVFGRGHSIMLFSRAMADPDGALIVSATSNARRATREDMTLEELGTSVWVRRLRPGSDRLETLFTSGYTEPDSGAVSIPGMRHAYVIRSWDMNSRGEIIYADPAGGYRAMIGHPSAGNTEVLDLPVEPEDDDKIRELVKRIKNDGVELLEIHRIAALRWLDDRFLSVVPAAELQFPQPDGTLGTVEVFDRNGGSFGRFHINCEYDPANDVVMFQRDIAIVIHGGQAVARAPYGELMPEEKQPETAEVPDEVYEVRVWAYRLFASLRGID